MPLITYNNGIPAANNNPSVDQPDMQTNTDAIDTLIAVDHVSFNNNDGGLHHQVNFNNKNAQGSQTDPQSVLYTASGTASSVSQLVYKNQNAVLPISTLRAFAYVTVGTTPGFSISIANGFNVSTVTRISTGSYNIVLTANATTGTNFAVIFSSGPSQVTQSAALVYTITGANTFNLLFGISTRSDPKSFSFQVLQL